MTGGCSRCGAIGSLDRHHLTGRTGPGLAYLDRALVLPLCRACHAATHAALRAVGLAWPPVGDDPVAYRMLRVSVHLDLAADAGRPVVLDPPDARALAALLRDGAAGLGHERREGVG